MNKNIKTILGLPIVKKIGMSEAHIILASILNVNRAYLIAFPEIEISPQQQNQFINYLYRRLSGEPIAYLLGQKEFWSELFEVNQYTLIPRPETELLIEIMLEKFNPKQSWQFLELGTGSGVIGLTLAKIYATSTIIATEISAQALQIAKKNQQNQQLNNIFFIQNNWFSGMKKTQKYHAIISNPPYLAEDDFHLKKGDLRFEPKEALVSGKMGLDSILAILSEAHFFLLDDGFVVLEHGYNQEKPVREIFQKNRFHQITLKKDLNALPRVTFAKLSVIKPENF